MHESDLEELKKAIRSGDKERAERIAVTMFKNPHPKPKIDPNLLLYFGCLALLGVIMVASWWLDKKKKKEEEMIYV